MITTIDGRPALEVDFLPGLEAEHRVTVTFLRRPRLRCYSVTVRPLTTSTEMTARALRGIKLGELVRDATDYFTKFRSPGPQTRAWAKAFRDQKHPGRAGRDDLFYAVVASAYVSMAASGTPVKGLAALSGLADTQVRDLVSEARRRELLSRMGRGKAGGVLTPKAQRLLHGARRKARA